MKTKIPSYSIYTKPELKLTKKSKLKKFFFSSFFAMMITVKSLQGHQERQCLWNR